MKKRPSIVTIAGFDPSGGAGILADIKTYEANRCNGFAVQTANTIQTEDAFLSVNWISEDMVFDQLRTICNRYDLQGVKIGLIPSIDFLIQVISIVRESNKKVLVIWDPILSASAGFDFKHDLSAVNEALSQVDWITPNWDEITKLSFVEDAFQGAKNLANYTKVYLKGGHNPQNKGKDYCFEGDTILTFNPKSGKYSEKHGSGCVFSSALISNLVKGYPKQKAVLRSKRYIEKFLASDSSKLGKHNT